MTRLATNPTLRYALATLFLLCGVLLAIAVMATAHLWPAAGWPVLLVGGLIALAWLGLGAICLALGEVRAAAR